MKDAPLSPKEIDDAFAAEYVLGVLGGTDRAEAETRAKRDSRFAALISAWEFRLGGLNAGFPELPVANLFPAIEARIFASAARAQSWQGRRSWLISWVCGAMVAATLVVATVAFVIPLRIQHVATLASGTGALGYDVGQFGQHMRVTRTAGKPADEGLVHELWLIAPGDATVSLGLLRNANLIINQPAPAIGSKLSISVEPEGGSKTGRPTGPVILQAEIGAKISP
jgi:anti-sigma-K factor RskA